MRLPCDFPLRWPLAVFAVLLTSFAAPLLIPSASAADTTPAEQGAAGDNPAPGESNDEYYELLKLFVDALDQVERNYVKDLSRRELVEAAIDGMLSKLDQHTDYIEPEELDRFRSGVENQFGGIGIQVSVEGGRLTIMSPLVNTPAYRAGLASGDVITHIEGKTTEGLSLDDAVKRLKGKIGTKVRLQVLDPDNGEMKDVSLTRELIRVETVLGAHRRTDDTWDFLHDAEHGVGYVRLTAFGRNTARELRKALTELKAKQMQALILDLRFNPGGLLSSAVDVADLFLSDGRIVSTQGRNVPEQIWDAHKEGTFGGFPMVVLVNRYSASASEIVAASLQDHDRAVVVGQRTYGKGSVQNIVELEGGRSAMKITTASYVRPSGKNIDRVHGSKPTDDWGVRPNQGFDVVMSRQEIHDFLEGRRLRDAVDSEADDSELESLEDPQLDKAMEYLAQQLAGSDGDQVAAGTSGDEPPAARNQ
jgi:carboxyl-terminal processing protease